MSYRVITFSRMKISFLGEVAEWLKAAVLKTVKPLRASGVRIPPSPNDKPI